MSRDTAIILIAYHFHPSNEIGARRVTKLAQFLAAQGIKVLVVSQFDGAQIRMESEIFPGVIAIPVPQPATLLLHHLVRAKRKLTNTKSAGSMLPGTEEFAATETPGTTANGIRSSIKGAWFRCIFFVDMFKRWAWHASRAAVRAGRHHQARLVISSSPPHSMHLAGMRVASKLNIPHVADFRDAWVDSHADFNLSKPTLDLRLTTLVERMIVRNAAAVTCTAPTLIERLAQRHRLPLSTLHLVRNGFDGPVGSPVKSSRKLNVLYAGEIYVNRDPFPFLSAVEDLLRRPQVDSSRVQVTFVGKCDSYKDRSLKEWLQDKKCRSVVSILPPVALSAIENLIQDATVLLNLTQNAPLMVPAKTYDQIASGREVLLICEEQSDAARMLEGVKGVTRVDADDQAGLNAALWDLYKRHVMECEINAPLPSEVAGFSRETANRKFLAIISAAIDGRQELNVSPRTV